jgi:hypothetical protein
MERYVDRFELLATTEKNAKMIPHTFLGFQFIFVYVH